MKLRPRHVHSGHSISQQARRLVMVTAFGCAVILGCTPGDAVDWTRVPRYASGQAVLVLDVARVVPVRDPCDANRQFRSVYLAVDPAMLPLVPAPFGAAAPGPRS